MTEARIAVLEQQYHQLAVAVPRFEEKIDNVQETLKSLVRIEERQISINARLTEGSQTMQEHGQRLSRLERAVPDNLGKRLGNIETKMPGLVETRKWIVLGVLGGLGMMGAALAHMVLK